MLTPLALPTTAVQKIATPTLEVVCAKPARPSFKLNKGGKAPRAMADIRAYQRAHREPTFFESESDKVERNESEANHHLRSIASSRPQAAPAP